MTSPIQIGWPRRRFSAEAGWLAGWSLALAHVGWLEGVVGWSLCGRVGRAGRAGRAGR